MTRWLPVPGLSLALFAGWLLLNQSLAPGHLLLGAVLAWLLPLLLRPYTGHSLPLRRPRVLLRLALVVLVDIVKSNVEVARRVLGPEAAITPGFVRVPLALTEPRAIATLAGIVTMTPGTLSCDVAPDNSHLLVHALHVTDADALVAEIKARYEAPLAAIFA